MAFTIVAIAVIAVLSPEARVRKLLRWLLQHMREFVIQPLADVWRVINASDGDLTYVDNLADDDDDALLDSLHSEWASHHQFETITAGSPTQTLRWTAMPN